MGGGGVLYTHYCTILVYYYLVIIRSGSGSGPDLNQYHLIFNPNNVCIYNQVPWSVRVSRCPSVVHRRSAGGGGGGVSTKETKHLKQLINYSPLPFCAGWAVTVPVPIKDLRTCCALRRATVPRSADATSFPWKVFATSHTDGFQRVWRGILRWRGGGSGQREGSNGEAEVGDAQAIVSGVAGEGAGAPVEGEERRRQSRPRRTSRGHACSSEERGLRADGAQHLWLWYHWWCFGFSEERAGEF